jgi:hypothetical protein
MTKRFQVHLVLCNYPPLRIAKSKAKKTNNNNKKKQQKKRKDSNS